MNAHVAVASLVIVCVSTVVACGSSARDARYPSRNAGCAVKSYVAEPSILVDDLGMVEIDCDGAAKCGRKLLDEVCKVGGDVVWGIGENAVTSPKLRGHAAHSANQGFAARDVGCDVKVYKDAAPGSAQNLGPVSATCSENLSDVECTRALQDEACKLGGDIVWGVAPPVSAGNKKILSGRAAHSK